MEITPQIKRNIEIKPTVGQGRVEARHKKPQVTKNKDAATDKLQENTENTYCPKYT